MSAIQKNPDGSATGAAAVRQKHSPAENERTGLPTEAGNVDKIREILFGGQMRDYDKRFSRLEERLMKESNELRENTRRSIETLESFVRKEFEALGARLDAERQGRDGVARELHDTASTMQKKLEDFENLTAQAQRDLRQQLLDQSRSLNDEIRRKHDEISTALQREVADLNDEKTDRLALAALFTEVALRLNQDFKIPGDNEA